LSSRPSQEKEESLVPLSVVFISVGLIVLVTVATIWLAAPLQLPERIELAIAPFRAPTAPAPAAVLDETPGVLLPETSPLSGVRALPSFASAATAPTFYAPVAGQPLRIVIPRIELDAPVRRVDLEAIEYEGQNYFQWQVPYSREAGWHSDSALLGEAGNIVLNGHHNIYGEVFRYLVDLEIGDEIVLYDENEAYRYTVEQQVLLPEQGEPVAVRLANAAWMDATDEPRLTLVTCWPYTGNTHRLIVVAVPASDSQEWQ
jgi:LPXTG-site transpeptidase (sortase) family protein